MSRFDTEYETYHRWAPIAPVAQDLPLTRWTLAAAAVAVAAFALVSAIWPMGWAL